MNAKQLLKEAIRTYNIDTFDEEQKHLHVTLGEYEDQNVKMVSLVIPVRTGFRTFNKTYAEFGADELAYQELLMSFIHYSLNHLTK